MLSQLLEHLGSPPRPSPLLFLQLRQRLLQRDLENILRVVQATGFFAALDVRAVAAEIHENVVLAFGVLADRAG